MDYVLKKTHELTAEEKEQICSLYKEVFGVEKSVDFFEKQFQKNPLRDSYHGLMKQGDRIVGSYSAIPFRYHYFGREETFAISVDTMIHKDARESGSLYRLANQVYDELVKDGIPFVFCFPNENIYLIRKKLLRWTDIGRLSFYVLPIRVGALKPSMKMLNVFSRAAAGMLNALPSKPFPQSLAIEKVDGSDFENYRYAFYYKYSALSEPYIKVELSPTERFVYRIESFSGARAAFLLDVQPLEKSVLQRAVKRICKDAGKRIDVIIYIGNLKSAPKNLLRLPSKLEPKKIYMSGKILDPKRIDERVFDLANWNVNLSNYDVI